jgi:toxin ParE1/3/4
MAEIIWTESAFNDLNEIAEYIALSNPIAAADLVRDLITKVERLEQFPKSGRILPEIVELNYREVIVPPCRVFYRLDKTSVYIVHICREERDLRKFLIERGSFWAD